MSNRDTAIRLIKQLPPNASLMTMARKLEFVAGVKEGLAQAKRGEGVPATEVRKLLKGWIQKYSTAPVRKKISRVKSAA